jgi:hypothetical protein
MSCRICEAPIPLPRPGQRFCSPICRQAGFRRKTAKKQGVPLRHKAGVHRDTGRRYETDENALYFNGDFGPPTYYYTVAGTKPLSDVEIAALGGFVVRMK